jgi:hypothetical protein
MTMYQFAQVFAGIGVLLWLIASVVDYLHKRTHNLEPLDKPPSTSREQ